MSLPLAPGPAGKPLIGSLLELRRDALGFVTRMREEYGDLVRLRLGPHRAFLVTHPDLVRHVLLGNGGGYARGGVFYDTLTEFLGQGQLTSTGPHWLRLRRMTQPVFKRERLLPFCKTINEQTSVILDRWNLASRSGEAVDVSRDLSELTLSVVGRTVFGVDLGSEAGAVGQATTDVIDYVMSRSEATVPLPSWLPTPLGIRYRRARKVLDDLIYGVIAERRASGSFPDDLLSMMMQARDEESGEGMTDEQLRDQVVTMLMAGHETTANALSWACYLLALNPDRANRLVADVDDILRGEMPEAGHVPRLDYVRMVVEESMRIYPPAWFFGRAVLQDDVMAGHPVPAGSMVIVSPYVVHHHPDFWDRPAAFVPERFDASNSEGRHPYSYIPFGGGAHFCVGKNLAMLEAVMVLASLVSRFRLKLVDGYRAEMDPGLSLRIRDGLPMIPEMRA